MATGLKTTKINTPENGNKEKTLLKELFAEELKSNYWAEKQLSKVLLRMSKGATAIELSNAFKQHITITESHINRLEQTFKILGVPARGKKCESVDGLVKEAQQVMETTEKDTAVRDVALIISAQKIEHYEIAAYGSLVKLANTIGKPDIAHLMQQTLDEEKEADKILTQIAESGININADIER